ncbi:MAG: hypothetical protein KDM91_10105, partial [Verrucomicrobiae bacterium]|nr:hypothetical protein [Verrucomicrobiae bacterium]
MRRIAFVCMLACNAAFAGEDSPALAKDLEKLAGFSTAAKTVIDKSPRAGALNFFGELGYRAAEVSGWSFERMQLEFPALCKEGQLVATVYAEDGLHYVIYTTDGLGPFAGTVSTSKGFERLSCGESVKLRESAGYYHYSVVNDLRGDVLVATLSPRIVRDATVQTVFIAHLYIHDGRIKVLKHITEEYPIRAQSPKEGEQNSAGQPATRSESDSE